MKNDTKLESSVALLLESVDKTLQRNGNRPLISQIINSVRLKSLSLKYVMCKLLGWQEKGIRKIKFVAKTQFLCKNGNFFLQNPVI